jgi:hypothetical protein
MVRVRSVRCLQELVVELDFTDGVTKAIDLAPFLRGQVFAPHRTDPSFFGAVRVDREAGTIVWPDGTDLDPDVLRWGLRPASWDSEPRRS